MDSQVEWDWERCHGVWIVILSAEHILMAIVLAYIIWLVFNRQAQYPDPDTIPQKSRKCTCYRTDISPLCLK